MNEQKVEKRTRFISLRVKLLVGFTVLFSVVFALAFYWFYNFATEQAMVRIQEDLVDTLNGAVAGVDAEQFVALAAEGEPGDDGLTDDPRYWELLAWLETVHEVEPRAYPYTYIKGEEPNEILWVGDGTVLIAPEREAAGFLESYISSGALIESLEAQTLKMEPYTDDWGHWVSAYAPIEGEDGEKVGGLGIDFRADYVFQVQQAIRDRVLVAFIITYVVLFALVYLISRALTQPVIALTTVAEHVAEGDYDQDMDQIYSGATRDEVSTLAQVFEMMIDKVRAREEKLKRQVQKLRIEIDQVKKAKQVEQITGSDYFQDLKQKARELRNKR
jgi:HAMP domain-containing protein